MLAQDASRRTRKAHVDSQAAAFILQGFLDRLQAKAKITKTTVEETHDDL
jgi:RNase H-fold protein (predicted Holliday junction resolvase)